MLRDGVLGVQPSDFGWENSGCRDEDLVLVQEELGTQLLVSVLTEASPPNHYTHLKIMANIKTQDHQRDTCTLHTRTATTGQHWRGRGVESTLVGVGEAAGRAD